MADARRILELKQPFPSSFTLSVTNQGKVVRRVRIEELGIKPNFDETLKNTFQIGRRNSLKASLQEFLAAWRKGIHLPLSCDFDERNARQILKQIAQSLDCPPQRALVEWQKGTFVIIPSKEGSKVAIERTLKVWKEHFRQGQWRTLSLVVTKIQPEVATEDVASIDGVVGQATTYFRTSERNRSHNIRLAASKLDHVLIRPGETISFNEIVGPRTFRRGFLIARVLSQGQFTVDFGGGVCQVAGTLYLAALRAGMEIVQRHRHSRPVAYLPPGLDATVNFGSLDLKLRNPFETPLYLRTFVRGGRLTVLVLGKQQGVTYKILRRRQKSKGYSVVVWRLKLENEFVKERELVSSDIYPLAVHVSQVRKKKQISQKPQPFSSSGTDGIPFIKPEESTSPKPTSPEPQSTKPASFEPESTDQKFSEPTSP